MAKASAKKKSVVKKAITKKEAVKPEKASAAKVLAFSSVKKAQAALDKALVKRKTQAKKVIEARKKVTTARKKLAISRTPAAERALANARIAVGRATEALVKAKGAVNLAKLKWVEAKSMGMIKIAEDEAAERLSRVKDELAIKAESDLLKARDAFIAAWSKKRATEDARKLRNEAKVIAKQVAWAAKKAEAKVVAVARKTQGKTTKKRHVRSSK